MKSLIAWIKSLPVNYQKIKRIAIFVTGLFFIVSISGVLTYGILPVYYTPLMFQRVADNALHGKKIRFAHRWVSIKKISPYMVQAAIAAEDNNFVNHFGIDFKAIEKAYEYNKRGKRIRGASTITQQTCKNIFLWQNRTYVRKALEVYFTLAVELFWSKKRIMEVYLNSIEMGDGIYGIEAASQYYFKKPASKLTPGEAALIAAIFPNPRHRNPAAPNAYLLNRQKTILNLMYKIGKINL